MWVKEGETVATQGNLNKVSRATAKAVGGRLWGHISIVAAVLVALLAAQPARASNGYNTRSNTAIQNLYGATAGWGGSCTTCHGTVQPDMGTTFGNQFDAQPNSVGNNATTVAQFQTIYQAMATLDSDGDGATNEQEFRGRTDPADKNSKPGATPTPTPTPTPPNGTPRPTPIPGGNESDLSSVKVRIVGGCGADRSSNTTGAPASVLSGLGSILFLSFPILMVLGLRGRRDEGDGDGH